MATEPNWINDPKMYTVEFKPQMIGYLKSNKLKPNELQNLIESILTFDCDFDLIAEYLPYINVDFENNLKNATPLLSFLRELFGIKLLDDIVRMINKIPNDSVNKPPADAEILPSPVETAGVHKKISAHAVEPKEEPVQPQNDTTSQHSAISLEDNELQPVDSLVSKLKAIKRDRKNFAAIYNLLEQAVEEGDEETIRFAIKHKYTTVMRNSYDNLIRAAACEGNLPMIKLFEKCGFDMRNEIILHSFCSGGSLDGVKYALQFHPDVNEKDSNNWRPLHNASTANRLDIVKFLLSQPGIDKNPLSRQGFTPLDKAVTKGHKELAEYMRGQGCLESKDLDNGPRFITNKIE
ncbi:hypothetical protein TVAG_353240 [Trichomonas vaginalis G3]|uniref:Uncharacterized protein n=1 Tax=Trichomonas vaginalis (strain ATCC PRA-98 / G3) TaxID=412133 RepID=A2EN47_TRIV3|nr:proteasome regulatory particle assembly [Trichomonas vaginalis G3]EAY05884.1 hypothetical protein TVAG_353240 [Trichomonas vaginalis G3]KAI5520232.1 proteasome regulatory particle assembly [Trichomonas vaginalis G3]|eukprot:XP_001318107.1 hypothetical protein [Trichomonas vaginalis G3]